jgi:hypothetical protein
MRDLEGKELAADFFIVVDDVRPCGRTKSEAWKAAHKAASTINWLAGPTGCRSKAERQFIDSRSLDRFSSQD